MLNQEFLLVASADRPQWSAEHARVEQGMPLARRLVSEFLGTGLLAIAVIGSGMAAEQFSPSDTGLQLLENSTASALGLAVLILVFGPVSGAHFNPIVSLADWLRDGRRRMGLTTAHLGAYIAAQTAGAVVGAVVSNAMFDHPALQISTRHRVTGGHLIGEIVAAAGLIAVGFVVARHGRVVTAAAVATYLGSAIWFTSSGSFANPALTVGRMLSDSFTGIAPASAPAFVIAQIVGGLAGLIVVALLYRPTRGS
ncbi:MIP/aquaporin family protein [Nocardia sp. NPDC051030]|uniref:MIP/aquaporin family protein n=1 Tax=Nocardia sp. NPDC051030 TaxID=3155162 RepID=UPI00344409AB